jgi:hypothetical protein
LPSSNGSSTDKEERFGLKERLAKGPHSTLLFPVTDREKYGLEGQSG